MPPDAHRHPDSRRSEGDGGKQAGKERPVEQEKRHAKHRPEAQCDVCDPDPRRAREPAEQVLGGAFQPDAKEERNDPELGQEGEHLRPVDEPKEARSLDQAKGHSDKEVPEEVGKIEALECGLCQT